MTKTIASLPKRSITAPNYLNRMPLDTLLQKTLHNVYKTHPNIKRILDLGSGKRYYEPMFADGNAQYVALDIGVDDCPDVSAFGEALPFADQTFDLIVCIQVLEHVNDPHQVIREISRVLCPGGVVLLSTHGTMFYHPTPNDYWRWTQTGLQKIFRDYGQFSKLEVQPVQGTFQTLGFFLAWYNHLIWSKIGSVLGPLALITRAVGAVQIAIINLLALLLDRVFGVFSKPYQSGSLFGIFLVTAER